MSEETNNAIVIVNRPSEVAVTPAPRQLPIAVKRAGQTVAVSALALVAKVGFSWLQKKATNRALQALKPQELLARYPQPPQGEIIAESVTVIHERTIKTTRFGLTRTTTERAGWKMEK